MIIEAKGIEKSFGPLKVLKGLDFYADAAEIVAIMGASGAGKSTLLQILGTLLRPESGSLTIDGIDALSLGRNDLSDFRCRKIGFVFQFHHLLPEFASLENVMIPALIAGTGKAQAKEKAIQLLDTLGLTDRLKHKPSELSGGEQQRVSIARALAKNPRILLCDEPTGALDSATAKDTLILLEKIHAAYGTTILMVTHNQVIPQMMRRNFVMKDGLIIEDRVNEHPVPAADLEGL